MFTGIIKHLGQIENLQQHRDNLIITVKSEISSNLTIDQSVSHNGICLTIISQQGNTHVVSAIEETLKKTNLGKLRIGDVVNLETSMQLNSLLDGHIVQGHVDQIAICIDLKILEGSWEYTFKYDPSQGNITVEKGSICVNGISLTVINSQKDQFSVAVIPYTYYNTSIRYVNIDSLVNLEFDILGKYVSRYMDVLINNRS